VPRTCGQRATLGSDGVHDVDWQPAVGARTVTAEAARYSRRDREGIEDGFRTEVKAVFGSL
jgi:hypothetical protein